MGDLVPTLPSYDGHGLTGKRCFGGFCPSLLESIKRRVCFGSLWLGRSGNLIRPIKWWDCFDVCFFDCVSYCSLVFCIYVVIGAYNVSLGVGWIPWTGSAMNSLRQSGCPNLTLLPWWANHLWETGCFSEKSTSPSHNLLHKSFAKLNCLFTSIGGNQMRGATNIYKHSTSQDGPQIKHNTSLI